MAPMEQATNFDFLSERFQLFLVYKKKGKNKVQGVPHSQTADLPRHQEEEETE